MSGRVGLLDGVMDGEVAKCYLGPELSQILKRHRLGMKERFKTMSVIYGEED